MPRRVADRLPGRLPELDPAGAGELSEYGSDGFRLAVMRSAIAAVVVVRSTRLRASVSRVPVRASSSVGVVPCLATRDHEGMHVQPPCWRTIEFFAAPRRGRVTDVFPELTRREHQVLGLIAADRGNAGIRGELVLSLKTVRNHGSSIFTKLQVVDRARAMVSASDTGRGG